MLAVARPLLAGTAYDAEDAVQDALMRAQRALPRTDGPILLGAWLAVVVRNRALDLRRRRDAVSDELPLTLVARNDVAEEVARRDDLRHTVRALRALPERQRAALVGHVLEGVPHRQMAVRLHTTVPGVKALVSRARAGLPVAA
jgi:RNA polymerase sigma-70 factor (ECF subfamily)